MEKKMLRNGLIIGIISLFMGLSIIPGINGNIRTIMNISGDTDSISETYYNGPQEEWNKTFGGENRDWLNNGMELDDTCIIVCGSRDFTQSYLGGDGWLVKLDSEGNLILEKTFGGTDSDFCNGLLEASDGGFVLGFTTDSFGSGYYDIRLVKIDEEFNEEWDKLFSGSYDKSAHCFNNAFDDGYLITGWTTNIDNSGDLWLIKTDSSGNEEWNTIFGGSDRDGGNDVLQTNDRGYIVVGSTCSYGAGEMDGWLIKIDGSGNEEWKRTFGMEFNDGFNKILKTDDNGYIIIGSTQLYDSDDDIWLLKFDSGWNLEWERIIGNRNYNEKGYSIQQTSDAGYILTGVHRSAFITGNQQGLIMKVDSNGYVEWSKLFGGPDDDFGRTILQTSDGGYIVVGETKSYGMGDIDGWIVKFSAEGNQRPNKPSKPSGPSSGNANVEYVYTTSTIDPDGGQIFYMWDWGDGGYSQWLGPYNSGEECSVSHMWSSRGNYEIKVKAKDTSNAESEWSDPLPVSMPKNGNSLEKLRFFSDILNNGIMLLLAFPTEFSEYETNYTFMSPGRGYGIWITPEGISYNTFCGAVLDKDKFYGIANPIIVVGLKVI
jgi:hypothetical protein